MSPINKASCSNYSKFLFLLRDVHTIHRWWHWSRIRIVEIRRSLGSQILVRERSTSSWQLFCHVTQIMMVNVDVRGWHDNDNGSCNGNDNEKSDRVGSTRRREPIRVRGLGCCRAPIVRSKTVVWGTFHIHCPTQQPIVAIIIVFAIDTQMRLNCYINYRVSIYMPASSFSRNANTFKVGLIGGGEAP